jgi:hypothetical protein
MKALSLCFGLAFAVLAAGPADAARGKKPAGGKKPPAAAVEPKKPEGGTTDPRAAPAPAEAAAATSTDAPAGEGSARRGPARIEFDDRLVQGQTNKANAIYLFERRESALRSLLKKRTHFHEEMDEMLEDELVK